jgi:hypothetical protein
VTDDKTVDARDLDGARPVATAGAESERGAGPRWASLAVAILFGLFFAYDLFSAVSNVVQLTAEVTSNNTVLSAVGQATISIPWVFIALDVLAPVVVYGLAFWLARRRPLASQALIFFVGLTVVAAVTLTINSLVAAATSIG